MQAINDIDIKLQQRSELYRINTRTAQPIPVIVGNFQNIIASYVCFDDVRYRLENPIRCVDTCFKIIHALNASYPFEVEPCWTFLQKYIYQINTKSDKNYVSVATLMSDLNSIHNFNEN